MMKKLPTDELELIRQCFTEYIPDVPNEYIQWLEINGYGQHVSGYEIYATPVKFSDVFNEAFQRLTGEFLMIGVKEGKDYIGYRFNVDEKRWELIFFDTYLLHVDLITEGLDKFMRTNANDAIR